MQKRHLDKKRLSIIVTTISLVLLFIALMTVPVIKSLEASVENCIDNQPKTTGLPRLTCKDDRLDLSYEIQIYTLWIGILLLLGYWVGIPLIIKTFNYLLPKKEN